MSPRAVLSAIVVATAAASAVAAGQQPPPRPSPAAQQPARDPGAAAETGTASILGQILSDDGTGRPIRYATVSLNGSALRGGRQTVTDAEGRFVFADLPPGRVTLMATKPAYLSVTYGSTPGQPTVPLELKTGQRETIALKMSRGGVIAGRIVDEYGRPLSGVRLQATQYRAQAGQRLMTSSRSSSPTDDRGMYRFYGLAPGEWVISATANSNGANAPMVTADEVNWARSLAAAPAGAAAAAARTPPPSGQPFGFAPVFYPGTNEPGRALPIVVAANEEKNGVDFSLRTVPLARVTGQVMDPNGAPPQGVEISLYPSDRSTSEPQLQSFSARTDGSGKFTINSVPPGQFTIFARSMTRPGAMVMKDGMFFEAVPAPAPPVPPVPPVPAADGHIEIRPGSAGAQTLWGMAEVAVSGQDVENIQLSLQPAMKVAGRIVFEATTITPPADLSRTQVTLQPVAPLPFNSTVPRAVVQPDGSFIVNGLMPGKYRLSATAPSAPSGQPAQWGLKSVSMGGVEALDAPIDLFRDDLTSAVITFTDRIASFTGVILDGKEQPVVGINVLLFSTDRTFWGLNSRRVLSRRSLAEGKFSFFNVPPGEYYLVTMADITQNDWQAPAMLEQLAGVAFKLTIDEGQKLNMPLKFAGGN